MSSKRRDSKGRLLRSGEAQREDGRYMYRYTDTDGKRQTIYSWRLTSTDAIPPGRKPEPALRDLESNIQQDIRDGIHVQAAKDLTVDDLYKKFMDLRTDLKEATRCNYANMYRVHVQNVFGSRTIDKIKFSDVQKLYLDLEQNKGLKPSSIQKINAILYQMFDLAVQDDLLRSNPTSEAYKKTRRKFSTESEQRHALTVDQQSALVDYIYGSNKYKRLGVLFTVLLGTGMRISEALGLRWCDCDFKKEVIHVTHTLLYKESEAGGYGYRISTPKTKAGIRDIPMLPEVKVALQKEKRRPRGKSVEAFAVDGYTDFIFLNNSGKVYTQSFIFDAIQSISFDYNRDEMSRAAREGREPQYLPKFSAHILRHTFCTRLCESGVDIKIVQDVMGHKNIRTTMDIYNEATTDAKRVSFQNLKGKMKVM